MNLTDKQCNAIGHAQLEKIFSTCPHKKKEVEEKTRMALIEKRYESLLHDFFEERITVSIAPLRGKAGTYVAVCGDTDIMCHHLKCVPPHSGIYDNNVMGNKTGTCVNKFLRARLPTYHRSPVLRKFFAKCEESDITVRVCSGLHAAAEEAILDHYRKVKSTGHLPFDVPAKPTSLFSGIKRVFEKVLAKRKRA